MKATAVASMRAYIARKSAYLFLTLVAVATVNFLIFVLMPGDPVAILAQSTRLRPDQIERLIEMYGLRKPLWEKYVLYLRNMFTFNFGYSYYTKNSVWNDIVGRLPETLMLVGAAVFLSLVIGVALGVLAAEKRGGSADKVVLFFGLSGYALPGWWIGLILLTVFGYGLGLFPLRGSITIPPPTDTVGLALDRLWHMFLPVTALTITSFGGPALVTRNQLLDVLTEDFIVVLRAKGLSRREVMYKHALKNVLPPLITITTISFAFVLVGAIITEGIFSWPGLGLYIVQAIGVSDYPALQGVFFLVATAVVLANYISDILYAVVDPRIQLIG